MLDAVPAIVYMAVNRLNGHMYIGVTTKGVQTRRRGHLNSSRNLNNHQRFPHAIRKYGIDNFAFIPVHTCDSFSDGLAKERELIQRHKPEYNLTEGGQGALGYRHSEEMKKSFSERPPTRPMLGKKHSLEARAKMSAAIFANPVRYWLGKKRDSETIRKIRETKKGIPYPVPYTEKQVVAMADNMRRAAAARSHPVICVTDGKEFASTRAATNYYGISGRALVKSCKLHKPFSLKKLEFRWKNDE